MHGFKALGKFVVFFSHQRLFWDQAGSDTIQFNAMTESLKILAARLQWDIEGMYIRLDILSIPQQNTSQKTLAVDSLNTYPVRPMLRSLSRMIRTKSCRFPPIFGPTSLESGHARRRCRSPPKVVLAKCSPRQPISVRFPRAGWPIWQRCWRGPLRQGELAAVHARDVLRSEPQAVFPQLAAETEQATKDGECSSELGSCACSFKLTIM